MDVCCSVYIFKIPPRYPRRDTSAVLDDSIHVGMQHWRYIVWQQTWLSFGHKWCCCRCCRCCCSLCCQYTGVAAAATSRHGVPGERISCWGSLNPVFSVFFLFIQTWVVFCEPPDSTVTFIAKLCLLRYIPGNYGHGQSQCGRQPVAASPSCINKYLDFMQGSPSGYVWRETLRRRKLIKGTKRWHSCSHYVGGNIVKKKAGQEFLQAIMLATCTGVCEHYTYKILRKAILLGTFFF